MGRTCERSYDYVDNDADGRMRAGCGQMTLRQRILLLGLVAIAGMCFALWRQYVAYIDQWRAADAIARQARAVGALSHAVHEIQKERGLTMLMLAGRHDGALGAQAASADTALARLGDACGCGTGMAQRLVETRAAIGGGMLAPLAARARYDALLQSLLDQMGFLAREPESAVAKAEISAHFHLVAAKEYLGQTRATLAFWIGDRSVDSFALRELVRIEGLYREEVRKFRIEAGADLLAAFDAHIGAPEARVVLNAMASTMAEGRPPRDLRADSWWQVVTATIDRLKAVEDASLERIGREAAARMAELRSRMLRAALATLVAGLVVLALTVSAIVLLLRSLGRMLAGMETIASSHDFHHRLPTDTPDEIGRISRNFNRLLAIAERLLAEKEVLATTDPLTGIRNRLHFTKVCAEEAERKRRRYAPMALIMFDIDHFKRINDNHGHNVGDEVLKALARLVETEIRGTDFFARWGGEEFVLLLRDDDCIAATAVAEKLRTTIMAANFPPAGKLTCSFGVAAWQPDDTEASLIKRADDALYVSKAAGRNRVTCESGVPGVCRGRAATCR